MEKVPTVSELIKYFEENKNNKEINGPIPIDAKFERGRYEYACMMYERHLDEQHKSN